MKTILKAKRLLALLCIAVLTIGTMTTANAADTSESAAITLSGECTDVLGDSDNNKKWIVNVQSTSPVMFYTLKKNGNAVSGQEKIAFQGGSLVLTIEDYDTTATYTVKVSDRHEENTVTATLYQIRAKAGDTTEVLANGSVLTGSSYTYQAEEHQTETISVGGKDYDVTPAAKSATVNETTTIGTLKYSEHNASSTVAKKTATIELVYGSTTLYTETIGYYGTYTYMAPRIMSADTADANSTYYVTENPELTLIADDNGKTIEISYELYNEQTENTWYINLIDLQTGKQLRDTIEKKVAVNGSSTYTADDSITVNGVTYTLAEGSEKTVTHEYGASSPATNIYYYNAATWTTEDGYTIKVNYVNYADRSVIKTETIDVTNGADTEIACPAEFSIGDATYIRLNGQSDTIEHSYYSNMREYTVYYRNSEDTLSADIQITTTYVYGPEITIEDVVYRVIPGTEVAVATNVNDGTSRILANGTGTTTGGTTDGTADGTADGTTDGTTDETGDTTMTEIESADSEVPGANINLDDETDTGAIDGTDTPAAALTTLANTSVRLVLIAAIAAIVILLIAFGVKRRKQHGGEKQ